MDFDKTLELMDQACRDSVLEIECPICEATIIAESDATDLYCEECKQIVMQNPLADLDKINRGS